MEQGDYALGILRTLEGGTLQIVVIVDHCIHFSESMM